MKITILVNNPRAQPIILETIINKEGLIQKTMTMLQESIKPIILEVNDIAWHEASHMMSIRGSVLCNHKEQQYFTIDDHDLANALYYYSKNYLKKRWVEAEPIIKNCGYEAYSYASKVLKRRWPEAESIIQNWCNDKLWNKYLGLPTV